VVLKAVLNRQSLEWLDDHRIFFHRDGLRRLNPGDALEFTDSTEIEPHVGFYKGDSICSCGVMSFTNSSVSPKISIGRYCSIGQDVAVGLVSHPTSHVSSSTFTYDTRTHLVRTFAADHGLEVRSFPFKARALPAMAHDVWIGARSTILPGVTLATGCIVAANSVVSRPVGPYEIVAGNPARLLRLRFDPAVVQALLESEWWAYRPGDFADLPLDRPELFLPAFLERKPDLEPYQPPRARMADMPRET
jgi:acetyltransferase-like isoleucine patch superfamily enzyme